MKRQGSLAAKPSHSDGMRHARYIISAQIMYDDLKLGALLSVWGLDMSWYLGGGDTLRLIFGYLDRPETKYVDGGYSDIMDVDFAEVL